MGPKRDIIGELSAATRKQGLVFGLSSHRIEHYWYYNEGTKIKSDVNDPAYADFYGPAVMTGDRYSPTGPVDPVFMNDWLLRCTELVDKYQPQLFWFDWWIYEKDMKPYLKNFAAYYYNAGLRWNKGVVINYKRDAFPDSVAVYDIERGSSKATRKFPWQTDTAIGRLSWGYSSTDTNKSPDELIDVLVDVVSKNGNLLLNVGPKSDGTIPDEQVNVLLAMGKWLDINGEGIYGSRTFEVPGEGPSEQAKGDSHVSERQSKGYTGKDIRFTVKGDNFYIYCLGVPQEKKINVTTLGLTARPDMKIKSVELLGGNEKLKWSQKKDALIIDTPKTIPSDFAIGFRVKFE
jgi:alpha-L-fucosidase